jgi:hypothetical protein
MHIGDNTGTVGQINKGYTTKEKQLLLPYLAAHYPRLRFHSQHMPGAEIPADEGSRGYEVDEKKLQAFVDKHALNQNIRDGFVTD